MGNNRKSTSMQNNETVQVLWVDIFVLVLLLLFMEHLQLKTLYIIIYYI